MQEFPSRLYGIIGYPLGHSMSPLMHNTAFRTLGIPGVFFPWPLEPAQLPAFVEAVRTLDIQGCSVTIPHKVALVPLLDEVTDRVRLTGAANTIFRRDGRICGEIRMCSVLWSRFGGWNSLPMFVSCCWAREALRARLPPDCVPSG